MLRIYSRNGDRLSCGSAGEGAATPQAAPGERVVWYDLFNPTTEEEALVEQWLGVSVPTRDEMKDIEPSARLYLEEGAAFMTVTALSQIHKNDPMKAPVTFVLKDDVLVTVRYVELTPFTSFETQAGKANPYDTGEAVLAGLIDAMINRLAQVLETAGDDLDAISREVFRRRKQSAARKTHNLQALIERIGAKGDLLTLTGESLLTIHRLTAFHQASGRASENGVVREIRHTLESHQRDVVALSDHAESLANKVTFLLDATLGLISLEQNKIIKIFSIAAVVFLPPTLVASIYGMNFDFMPELDWAFGYPLAIVLMVISAVLPYLFFKRKGWL